MGYLDRDTITVDAILTRLGRKHLSQGRPLNVTQFSAHDWHIDYRLWNTSHPSGSDSYGEAIANSPIPEAVPTAEYFSNRNKLITLDINVEALPVLTATPDSTTIFNDAKPLTIVYEIFGYSESTLLIFNPDSNMLRVAGVGQDISPIAGGNVPVSQATRKPVPTITRIPFNSDGIANVQVWGLLDVETTQHVILSAEAEESGAYETVDITLSKAQYKPVRTTKPTGG